MALLAGHGVFVLGGSARAVHQRAVALEQRCQHAWYARAAGSPGVTRVPRAFLDLVAASDGEGFIGFWRRQSEPSSQRIHTYLSNEEDSRSA